MNRTNHLLNRFKMNFSLFADEIESVELYGDHELIITTEVGTKILYDDFDQTIDFINDCNNNVDWRRRFGRKLRNKMIQSGMTQEELSKRAGVSVTSLSSYMNGRALPSIYIAYRLAEELGCSLDELLHFPK